MNNNLIWVNKKSLIERNIDELIGSNTDIDKNVLEEMKDILNYIKIKSNIENYDNEVLNNDEKMDLRRRTNIN